METEQRPDLDDIIRSCERSIDMERGVIRFVMDIKQRGGYIVLPLTPPTMPPSQNGEHEPVGVTGENNGNH